MGRGLNKKTVLNLGVAIIIVAILSLTIIAGCSNSLMDDIKQKVEEDKIADGPVPTYTVTYDGNGADGGTVPTDGNAYEEGSSVSVLGAGSMSRSGGYTFIGWNTASNGSGTHRGISDKFTMGGSNVTLYAQWTTQPTYTVDYSGNGNDGGTVPIDSNVYIAGAMVTVLGNPGSLIKTGNTLTCWNRQQDGNGTDLSVTETFQIGTANVTLYAKWTVNSYEVSYDGNGSDGGSVPGSVLYDYLSTVTVSNIGDLSKAGSTFSGEWNTQADGNGVNYTAGSGTFPMGAANITLYAMWTANFAIGDPGPAGGLVFYDKGSYSNGWRYMEAAPSDQSTGIQWFNGSFITTGATPTAIGTGETNTTGIVIMQGIGSYAARLCFDLSEGGNSDWFLPSIDELDLMYVNLKSNGVGGFADNFYWSSSESNNAYAWLQDFSGGSQGFNAKGANNRVRAVRDF